MCAARVMGPWGSRTGSGQWDTSRSTATSPRHGSVGAVDVSGLWCCCGVDLDISAWSVIRPESGGADEGKDWVAPGSGDDRVAQWLWKPRQTTGRHAEPAINDVAEVVASGIAGLLDLPAAECRYAVRDGDLGVVSKNVSPSDCDLHEGRVYLEQVAGYVRGSPRLDKDGRPRGLLNLDQGYTLDAVEEVLVGVTGPPGWEDQTAMQVFSGFLLLDALIANTDRHPRNWALLEPWNGGSQMLAPTYDHGRGLGSGLTEENRQLQDVLKFCGRGLAKTFEPREESLVSLALRAAGRCGGHRWLDRLRSLPDHALDEVVDASAHRLSAEASSFVGQMLNENRRRLCHADVADN